MHLQIRGHAAAALANLGQRCLFGDLWEPALQTACDAVIGLQNNDTSINAGILRPLLIYLYPRLCFVIYIKSVLACTGQLSCA